jgi:hypothetical protein
MIKVFHAARLHRHLLSFIRLTLYVIQRLNRYRKLLLKILRWRQTGYLFKRIVESSGVFES